MRFLPGRERVPTFKDRLGHVWPVRFDAAAINRIKAYLYVDVAAMTEAERVSWLGSVLMTDLAGLVDALYAVIAPEADRRGISDEDFGRALCGESIEHAGAALAEALALATTDREIRRGLRTGIRTHQRAWR